MWKVEEALPGRMSQGKGHQGPADERIDLKISGRRVYQMQKYFEERIEKGGEFFEVRMLVLLHEELRAAVENAQARDEHTRMSYGREAV